SRAYCVTANNFTGYIEDDYSSVQSDPSLSPPGPTAPSQLVLQASVRLKDHWDYSCSNAIGNPPNPPEVQVLIYACARNANGAQVYTNQVILFFPNTIPWRGF